MPFSDRRPPGAISLGPGGLRTADDVRPRQLGHMWLPRPPGAVEKLISENETGYIHRAAADKILSEHTAPSFGPVSIGRGTRPSNGLRYKVH